MRMRGYFLVEPMLVDIGRYSMGPEQGGKSGIRRGLSSLHYYFASAPGAPTQRFKADLELLKLDYEDNPRDLHTLYYLGEPRSKNRLKRVPR